MAEKLSLLPQGLKVEIIYNFPVMPSKGEKIDYVADAEVEEEVAMVEDALKKLDVMCQSLPLKDDITAVVNSIKKYNPDVVVNICEGVYGDSHLEMAIPSLLELLRVPYTGCPPLSLGLCQNKGLAKDVMMAKGVSTPKYQVLKRFKDWIGGISFPLFVKPLSEDGSIGISKNSFVENNADLKKQIDYITESYKQPALVEEYIIGRELNVSILEDESPKILPISEIEFNMSSEPKIVDYSAKWFKDSEEYKNTVPKCPANLSQATASMVEKIALKAYSALLCRDYARVDIRIRENIPYVLEVNPNPDISIDGGFARSLKAGGIPYEEFIKKILQSALQRSRGVN